MGFIKDAKAAQAGADAQKAYTAGHYIFAARLNWPATHHAMSGEVADWSQQIEAIERAGWALAEWAVGQDKQGRPEAYPVFKRRREQAARAPQ
ncbi:hypothetical protein ACFQ05_11705 [Amycolatopsis umgeniensis]|uniref:Uncharacterized protein n=1 Tax=Amycolatopsis umgeniensis TaxID=336628 RepID=A0A841B644_9PSEU|nr:hypothetical protein [Amycolatopsis umgeniensis]MBB5853964.1 hypothetical protein [Amycolatopsis umgeniensis]